MGPCAAAAQAGLACYRGRGGLAPIRLLGRPVILTLIDSRGRTAYALLTGLSHRDALLRVAGVERWVPLPVLARDWRGDFATLWRTPPGWRAGGVVLADGGAAARWLSERLDAVEPAGRAQTLTERVFAFQLAQGLVPDGLAGPQTLMQLNRASGVEEPQLAAP